MDDGEWVDRLPGGLADSRTPCEFDKYQLAVGLVVELEHVDDPRLALEIAMDHLTEDDQYYIKLENL